MLPKPDLDIRMQSIFEQLSENKDANFHVRIKKSPNVFQQENSKAVSSCVAYLGLSMDKKPR